MNKSILSVHNVCIGSYQQMALSTLAGIWSCVRTSYSCCPLCIIRLARRKSCQTFKLNVTWLKKLYATWLKKLYALIGPASSLLRYRRHFTLHMHIIVDDLEPAYKWRSSTDCPISSNFTNLRWVKSCAASVITQLDNLEHIWFYTVFDLV